MPEPALRKNFVNKRFPKPEDLSAEEYNLHAERTDAAYDMAAEAVSELSFPVPRGDALDAGGFTTIPRWAVNLSQTSLINNCLHLFHFLAPRTETVTKIRLRSGQNGAQGNTATLIRLAVWKIERDIGEDNADNPTDSRYVRLATTANNTSLLNTAWSNTADQTLSAPVDFVEGQEYAWSILIKQPSGETHWLSGMPNVVFEDATEPRFNGAQFDQTDIPDGPINFRTWDAVHVGCLYARFLA